MLRLLKNKIVILSGFILFLLAGFTYWYFKHVPTIDLEIMRIELNDDAYLKLSEFRDTAIEKGHLERSGDDYVPTIVKYRSEPYSGKLRLKGDWLDHLGKNKWSFRIKLDEPMRDGLKEFSIQNPDCRHYINSYIFYELMREEGIMANEFRFIQVYMNGKRWGSYCLEEHLTTRMITSNGRKNGVILKFDDSEFFTVAKDEGASTIGLVQKADIKVYGDAKKDEQYNTQVYRAKQIVQNYKDQTDSLYNDFDAKKMGTFYALCDLAIGYHAMGWINIRFFYNFETELMEPVAYDPYPTLEWGKPYLGHGAKNSGEMNKFDAIKMVYKALENEGIHAEYEKALDRFTSVEYVHNFIAKRRTIIAYYEKEIQKEYKSYEYDYDFLKNSAADIRKARSN